MLRSLRPAALAALSILPYTTTAYYQQVEPGPNVLDDCAACPRLYTNFYQCQQIAQPSRIGTGREVRDCVCVSSYDGWYTYLDACRGCIPGDNTHEFWGNLGRLMTHFYHVCLDGADRGNPPGNFTSDGSSICATDSIMKYENCMSLKDSSEGESWVSFRMFSDSSFDRNRTMRLNLAAAKPNSTTSTATESAASTTTATSAATGSDTTAATTTPATGAGSQDPSTTTGSEDTVPTSFAVRLSQGSQAGYVLGMVVVAGMVGGMI